MQTDRLSPIALVTGAGSGVAAACARTISRHAHGGLVLADHDEASLEATADALDRPPERVSTLAFDLADPDRWRQAADFIKAQYGRLDWAVIHASTPQAEDSDLVQWGPPADLDAIALALRMVMPLMRYNSQGAAIVLIVPATVRAPQFVRAAAKDGARDAIRVNAIATGASDAANWRDAPLFQDLVLHRGSQHAALDAIAGFATPLVRYAGAGDIGGLGALLLSDVSPVSGATLVVDGAYTI